MATYESMLASHIAPHSWMFFPDNLAAVTDWPGVAVIGAPKPLYVQYWIGGVATYSTTTVLGAMVGTHILIGVGEAIITFLTISAVISTRKDLVYGANKISTKGAKS